MGNLRINTLTPKTVNNSGFTYSDLKLDLTFDYTVNNELLKDKEIKVANKLKFAMKTFYEKFYYS